MRSNVEDCRWDPAEVHGGFGASETVIDADSLPVIDPGVRAELDDGALCGTVGGETFPNEGRTNAPNNNDR